MTQKPVTYSKSIYLNKVLPGRHTPPVITKQIDPRTGACILHSLPVVTHTRNNQASSTGYFIISDLEQVDFWISVCICSKGKGSINYRISSFHVPTVDGISSRDHVDIEERKKSVGADISFLLLGGKGRGSGGSGRSYKKIGSFLNWGTNL